MGQYWEPGTQYNYGDVVEYQGHNYKIIQPHRSQSDWTPDVTPALWGRLQGGDSGHAGRQEYQPQYQAPQQQDSYQQSGPQYGNEKQSESHGKLDEVKHWAQEHKQGLEVAGGIAAAGGLATAGLAMYKNHQQSQQAQQHEQQQGYQTQQYNQPQHNQPQYNQPQHNQPQSNHPSKVDEAKNWAQEHKTGLGIAAGAALLGGAALAYKHHQHDKEQNQD